MEQVAQRVPQLPHFPPADASHLPGTALIFPRDEGWHSLGPFGLADPGLRNMEWVYTNVHLLDGEGHHVVVFVAYFTQGLRLVTVRRFDPQWRLCEERTGTALGLLRPSATRHDLSYRHWGGTDRWANLEDAGGRPVPHASRLQVEGRDFSLDLTLTPQKAPYHAGGTGYLPFSSRGWFSYYSLTRMGASGTVTLGPRTLAVDGRAWLDHQWGPFAVTPFRNPRVYEEYEWFSLQLSDGSDVVLSTVWTPDGQLPSLDSFGGAGLMRADGSTAHLVGAHRVQRTGFYRDPKTRGVYSAGWRFVAPEWDCDLTLRPRHPAQMTPMAVELPEGAPLAALRALSPLANLWAAFWEGSCEVRGRLGGVEVHGDGFAELVKRYAAPRVRLEPPLHRAEGRKAVVVLRWRVERCDPAVELRYRVRVFGPDGRLLHSADDLDVSVFCFDDLGAARGACEVLVQAQSRDQVLRGEARTTVRLGEGRR